MERVQIETPIPARPQVCAVDEPAEGLSQAQSWRSWYSLGVLFVVYVFAYLDRSILGILAQPIKDDLQLSDTQLGFMGGIAFAVFYTFVGIPIARLADQRSRRNIISICVAVWSGMTVLCGFATNFLSLLLARVGVAVGEAGCSPPSHSIISDLFAERKRATALAIYALGIPVGAMLGNLIGGLLNVEFGWRVAFIAVGAPGLLLAVLVRLTLAEPARGGIEARADEKTESQLPITGVFRSLWALKSYRYMIIATALHSFVGLGVTYWLPSYFIRSHGLDTGTVGTLLFYLGIPGMIGTLLGGFLCDRFSRVDMRWYVWVPAFSTLLAIPFQVYVYLAGDYVMAMLVAIITSILGNFFLAPSFALAQNLVNIRMRALSASIMLLVVNLIGLGLGPQLTGIISDFLASYTDLGQHALRWALVSVLVVNVMSFFFYMVAGKYLRADIERAAE